jgi:hypothetical protein
MSPATIPVTTKLTVATAPANNPSLDGSSCTPLIPNRHPDSPIATVDVGGLLQGSSTPLPRARPTGRSTRRLAILSRGRDETFRALTMVSPAARLLHERKSGCRPHAIRGIPGGLDERSRQCGSARAALDRLGGPASNHEISREGRRPISQLAAALVALVGGCGGCYYSGRSTPIEHRARSEHTWLHPIDTLRADALWFLLAGKKALTPEP